MGPVGSERLGQDHVHEPRRRASSDRASASWRARRCPSCPRVLARVGYCPEADAMYDELTGHAFASLARLGGSRRSDAAARAEAILTRLDLKGAMHRPIGGYSRGMRQRAKLAQALVHDPEVLLLDEPLTGTDPISRQTILQEVRERAQAGTTVLFSTHVLHEVESLTDQVLLIVRGQVVAQGRTADIRAMMAHRPHHVRVDVSEPRALARALAEDPSVVALFLAGEGAVTVATKDPDSTYTAIARAIVDGNHELRALTSPDATLEALFHDLVERASRGAGTGSDAAVGSRHPGGTP
ncbi:MAG: ABC transporter ATP-binding protein [Polyangiales bacterium]